ncbi:transposase [Anaerococcus sp. AGMB09787]|uniref:transposase n=1 Tax=Anaerococcus sp. AGMB09787 TaxID=2922869 RepID=UPI001FAEA3DA|nr:transposase [Anaerococcus sp. AGMB09787]
MRKIDKYVDFDFIYDLVEEKYSLDNGRPSIEPVILIKLIFIQYLFNINSTRKTIREVEVNVAYGRFLGLDFYDKTPYISTFGKTIKEASKIQTYSITYLKTY